MVKNVAIESKIKLEEIQIKMIFERLKSNGRGYDAIKTKSQGPSFRNRSVFEWTCVGNISQNLFNNKKETWFQVLKMFWQNKTPIRILSFANFDWDTMNTLTYCEDAWKESLNKLIKW